MASSKPIGGVGQIRFNGNILKFRGSLTWNFQTGVKKGVAGRDGSVHGFTVDPVVPMIEGEFTYDGAVTTAQLEAITNGTITALLGDGRQLILRGAYVAGDIAPDGDDAKVKLKFEGTDGEEIGAPG